MAGDNCSDLLQSPPSFPMSALTSANAKIESWLTANSLTRQLVSSPSSSCITLIFVYIGILLISYETVLYSGYYISLWKLPGNDIFKETPTHCAHVYVRLHTRDAVLKYHFEFGPEDYDPRSPEHGTTLLHLKKKLVECWRDLEHEGEVGVENVEVRRKKRELGDNDEFLCNLGVETGDTIDAYAVENK
ncbi:unnamed protein product [Kuraishia capsulata CBS 1993]|uniref:Uncharacterized protein n=1 Tax=Kuraishia capsulata CBS 1993 TaxID=1382522 RepID=W6MRZ9_9ASCO|nr:uncharacterized protein KUCA_T00000566001 [Kuraishia capsulata CBS 1993]CDK24600.1 unnamed protein product [Kuraishia capsulata CBS 1993]